MDIAKKPIAIGMALLGCLFMTAYFWLAARSNLTELLRQELSKSEILSQAEQAYNNSNFVYYEMRRSVELRVDNNLLHYAQVYLRDENRGEFLPIGAWEIKWTGETVTKDRGNQAVIFSVLYDFEGNLIGMEQKAPELITPPNFIDELEAAIEARRFLRSLNVSTDDIELRNQVLSKDDRVLHYDFVFTRPSSISPNLQERYQIKISGQNITEYRSRVVVNPDKFDFPESDRDWEVTAVVGMLVAWTVLSLFMIGMFIRRLKQDVLEFKRGVWLGVSAFVMMFTYVAVTKWTDWIAVLAGGAGAGFLVGLVTMIVYSVTESLNREVWPQRIAVADLLFKGYFRFKEFGASMLHALFLAGGFLFLLAGLHWLVGRLEIGYISLDKDVYWIFAGNSLIVPNIFRNLLSTIFLTLMLFSFGLSYLRTKIPRNALLLILFGVFLNVAGFDLYYLRSSYWGFLVLLPLALLLAYCVYRFDLVTIFLATFLVNLFSEISLISLLPNGLLSPPGLAGLSCIFVMLATGTYFVSSKTSLIDFQKYVPSYVSRIAERERFLKELEIAQSVQARFLPQSVPYFPSLDIASICRPATEVGGDYYDFINNDDKRLGVVIGDVSGKGVSAAFYMTMVKGILKTLAKSPMTPKEMLTRMNAIFYENAPNHVFISMIYGLFDLDNRQLTFARAGHNPVICRTSQEGNPVTLNPRGLAIGLEGGTIFSQVIEEISLSLNHGDMFLFFTDGISESMNAKGDEFGEDRLRQIVHQNGECSADTLLTKITYEVDLFSGEARQHDDLTMVVIRVAG